MNFKLLGYTISNERPTSRDLARLSRGAAKTRERILTRIIEQARNLTKRDVDEWRSAQRAAINVLKPRRQRLLTLYHDLALDAKVFGLMEHGRKAALFSEDFRVVNADNTVDTELTDLLIQSEWFWSFRAHALDAKFWGHTLLEVEDVVPGKTVTGLTLIPREHVVPELGQVLIKPTDTTGIPYRNTPLMDSLMEIGDTRDLGLLNRCAPLVIYKKAAIAAWAEYIQIFGMPIRVGKTNTKSNEDMDRMEAMLRDLGQSAYGVFQEGETIEFIESTKGDAYNVYDKAIERFNSELAQLFLGQTMTTEVGAKGSRAQAEVHQATGNNVLESDKRSELTAINEVLFPFLTRRGWNVEGKRFEHTETKQLQLKWHRTLGLLPFFEVDMDSIRDTFGVEVTESKTDLNYMNQPQQAPADPKKQKNKALHALAKAVAEHLGMNHSH